MSIVLDHDKCDCSCHENGLENLHLVNCCEKCPHCGKRIQREHVDQHIAKCKTSVEAGIEFVLAE